MAQAVDECAAPYIWLTLDALVFRPRKGLEMEGYISLQNESHISLILWNYFTVTISQKRLPTGWTWHDSYTEGAYNDSSDAQYQGGDDSWGAWHDAQGNEVSGFLRFKIKDWDCSPPGTDGEGSFLSVYGSMLTAEEEKAYEKTKEAEREARMAGHGRKRVGRPRSASAERATPLVSAMKGSKSGKKKGRPPKEK
jgi:DNA-directed RNA polymerase I subunit RPA43